MHLLKEQKIFMVKIVALNKPYGVICQFSGEGDTLANYVDIPNIYPVGRLDKDSEGLVILTNDGKLQNKISNPKNNKIKTYIVQVEGEITESATNTLHKGVILKDGLTKPAKIKRGIAKPKNNTQIIEKIKKAVAKNKKFSLLYFKIISLFVLINS